MNAALLFVLLALAVLIGLGALNAAREAGRRRIRLAKRIADCTGNTAAVAAAGRRAALLGLPETRLAALAGGFLLLAGLAAGQFLNALVLSVFLVPVLWWFVRYQRFARLRRDFIVTFPEAVESFARAIKAGVPMERALEATADNYHDEVGRRFKALVADLTLGLSLNQSLERFSDNLDNADVDFFCQALALSRETGSPLSPILTTFCELIRERHRLDRRLAALTAESRASARILCAMPFFILGLQAFLNPGQLSSLISDPTGQIIIAYAAVSMLAGFAVITKLTRSLEN